MTTKRDPKRNPIAMSEAYYAELTESNMGICLACKAERDCCEPDARKYPCEECGSMQVYGVEELLIMGLIEFVDDEGE